MDRRVWFFSVAAVACFLLIPVAQREYRGIAAGVGLVYVVLAVACLFDHLSRSEPKADDDV